MVGTQWKRYLQEVEFYMTATAINANVRKRATLLFVGGEELRNIVNGLENVGETYDELVQALNNHFSPRTNRSFETHRFNSAKQKDNETIDTFAARIREIILNCDFPQNVHDRLMGDRIITGINSEKLRKKLLLMRNPTIAEIMEVARDFEAAERQSKAFQNVPDQPSTSSEYHPQPAAAVSTITKTDLAKLRKDRAIAVLPADRKLRAYGGSTIQTWGRIHVNLSVNSNCIPEYLYIVDEQTSLLSEEASMKLGLVKLTVNNVSIDRINVLSHNT